MKHSAVAVAAAAVAGAVSIAGQGRTTADGVFSVAQATRGEAVYMKTCASCHGTDVEGSGQAPSLVDADFAREWDGQPLSDLFERIRTTMPGDAPGTMKLADVADVLAFVLQKGHHAAGASDLPADPAALKQIAFSAKARADR